MRVSIQNHSSSSPTGHAGLKKGSIKQKMELARDWREHLRAQYHDRLIYWSIRGASRAFLDVLTIIIDSMDQVKTAWPQYKFARKQHCLENLQRPRVILSAVLCHGWCTNFSSQTKLPSDPNPPLFVP